MWKEIISEKDIKVFMDRLYAFHDSCIKEMRYISGAYVDDNGAMYPVNDKRVLRVAMQRQFDDVGMLELEFSGLQYMNLNPVDPAYTCEILGTTLLKKDGCFYWCDDDCIDENTIEDYDGTLICAEKLRWRPIEEHMGADEYYIPKD